MGHSHGRHDSGNANGHETGNARSGHDHDANGGDGHANRAKTDDARPNLGDNAGFETANGWKCGHGHGWTTGKEDEAGGTADSGTDFYASESANSDVSSFGAKGRKRRLEVQGAADHGVDAAKVDLLRGQGQIRGRNGHATGQAKVAMREYLRQRLEHTRLLQHQTLVIDPIDAQGARWP